MVHGELCSVSLAINVDVMPLQYCSYQASILIDISGNPLIADYGLATIPGVRSVHSPPGVFRWKAPELHTTYPRVCENHTTMSDVYAFALMCLEVC